MNRNGADSVTADQRGVKRNQRKSSAAGGAFNDKPSSLTVWRSVVSLVSLASCSEAIYIWVTWSCMSILNINQITTALKVWVILILLFYLYFFTAPLKA